MAPPTRILIVRLSHLGDVIHALPVFHALRAAHPDARIAWVVQPEFAGLLKDLEGLDECIPFERRGGATAWLRLHARLAAFGADWAIDAQGNWKSAMVALASGAARRSGSHRADWRERSAATSANDRAPRCVRGPHAVDRMLTLAEHVAPGVPLPSGPHLAVSPEVLAEGRTQLDERLASRAAPSILALGRSGDPRAWPESHVADCATELVRAGAPVLIVSGPAESDTGARLAASLRVPGVAHWVEQRGLTQLAGLFAAAAERGGTLLASDSGPAHLAAAVGLPVICLSGPQDAARTGPWPVPGPASPHRVLRAELEPDCAPCFARTCSHPQGPVCMSGIDPYRAARLVAP
ncbi:MAG: glycosyltransferase family 9 protein [Planctomycetes bacterium]|nr:glycosyltransferase family 9 protein [Planctomycetota bacterium]MCB9903415.1 glycosyltransferase family 9 protein [Planctomycetota bacterium]